MKFIKSTFITFTSSIFRSFVTLLISIIISRLLGPAGNGVVGIANNFIFFATLILGLGLSTATTYFSAKSEINLNSVISNNIFMNFFPALLLIPFYFLNLHYHFSFMRGIDNLGVIVLLILVPFTNINACLVNVFLGRQNIVGYNRFILFDKLLNFFMTIVFLMIYRKPIAVLFAMLASTLIVYLAEYSAMKIGYQYKPKPRYGLLNKMVSYGFKAQANNIVQMVSLRLDVFVINMFLPIEQVGIYSIAVSLAEALWKVTGSMAIIAFPIASSSKNKKGTSIFINQVTRISLVLIVIFSILIVILGKPLIMILFGKSYLEAVNSLILLLPGIALFSIANILANYLAGVNLLNKNLGASLISALVTVILDFALIPKMGINGASIATSIAYGVYSLILLGFYMQYTHSSWHSILLVKRSDIQYLAKKFHIA